MNTVPSFGDFNSAVWNTCERKLIKRGQDNCALQATQSVQMFIVVVVVAIPSTLIVLSDSTFQNKDDGQAGKKRMFPGNSHVKN